MHRRLSKSVLSPEMMHKVKSGANIAKMRKEPKKYTVHQMDRQTTWRELKSLPSMKLSIELSWQVIQYKRNSPSSLSDNLVY